MKFSRNVCLLVPVGLACTALVLLQLNAEPRANISNKQPLPELLPREKQIALAVSASPEHLRKGAGVYVLERNGFVKVRDSTNGFTCIVNRDHPLNWKPVCFDAEGTATILPKILRVGELLRQGKPMSKIDAEIAERFRTGKYHLAASARRRLHAFRRHSQLQSPHRQGRVVSAACHVLRTKPH